MKLNHNPEFNNLYPAKEIGTIEFYNNTLAKSNY